MDLFFLLRPEPFRRPTAVKWRVLWIERKGKVLLWKRASNERLLKNLWGLPEADRLDAAVGPRLAAARHTITHHDLVAELRAAKISPKAILPVNAKWITRERIGNYLISSLWRKLLTPVP